MALIIQILLVFVELLILYACPIGWPTWPLHINLISLLGQSIIRLTNLWCPTSRFATEIALA